MAVIVSEFSFLAGSIGKAAAQRIVAAIERATLEGLPCSQAPPPAEHACRKEPWHSCPWSKSPPPYGRIDRPDFPNLVDLWHPTTGGVVASWDSLGHINAAEPGALLGFLGPRVYEALHGEAFPVGVQTAENLFNKGLIDAVMEPSALPATIGRALDILTVKPSKEPALTPSTLTTKTGNCGRLDIH